MGKISAGEYSRKRLRPGETVRIFTGAAVLPGVEALVMKEHCTEADDRVAFRQTVAAGDNMRQQGEEFAKGETVLKRGTLITPPVLGFLASLGCAAVAVHAKPRVSVVATGNELIAPGHRLRPGQIYDSNSFALSAAVRGVGAEVVSCDRAGDNKQTLAKAPARALQQSEVVLTAGGVSVGDFDFVKEVAAELGIETVFWRVAIRPGMPNYFGVWRGDPTGRAGRLRRSPKTGKLVFGLPGNPVSALVSFHQLVRPALLRLMGQARPSRAVLPARLTEPRQRKPGRLEWIRGALARNGTELAVQATAGQQSHMLGGLASANCLIEFPAESATLAAGQAVEVERLCWTTEGP